MDTQKRIIIWVSSILVIGVAGLAVWQTTTNPSKPRIQAGVLSEAVTAGEWTKGATSPKATLVEYSDFQCPACGFWYKDIEEVVSENKDTLSFVYRHFPLPQHQNADLAARASEAAGAQGKFWEMHEKLFKNQRDWSDSLTAEKIFESYAQEIGLDMARYADDIKSATTKDAVAHDKETGIASGVNSTPSFYLNGKKISPKSTVEFKALIEDALK